MIDLSISIGNLKLKNPILLASGVWDLPYTDLIDFSRLGGIIYKGISLKPKQGNPPPRITEIPCGVINSIGLENEGIENFNKKILPELKKLETEIFINIFGESIEEFANISSKIRNASGIEINVSCPNVKEGGIYFGRDPDKTFKITEAVINETDIPVFVKLTPAARNIIEVAQAAKEAGATAVTASNTFPGIVIDIENRKPLFQKVSGGVSGPAIKPLALFNVYEISKNVEIPVIGSGGIIKASDVIEYLIAGARAVQLGSVIFNNPLAPLQIIDNINKYMEENNLNALSDLNRGFDE